MIVAVPTATAVTTPLAFTVAIAVFELLHVMTRPVSTLLAASRVTAVACVVNPTFTGEEASETDTVATGGMTVTVAEPEMPSLVAVMLAVPALMP